jgi:hypothetical protein
MGYNPRNRTATMPSKIESDLNLLKWMVGSNFAVTLVVLAFVLRGHV